MNKHLRYLKYLIRHKWFVMQAGLRLGVPLGILILHDWSKFLPDEWLPYADYFYGEPLAVIGPHGRVAQLEAFQKAWLLHQNRQKHHWQYWVLIQDSGQQLALEMPYVFRREMLADWIGANRAAGGKGIVIWWGENQEHIILAPGTRTWVESWIGFLAEGQWASTK